MESWAQFFCAFQWCSRIFSSCYNWKYIDKNSKCGIFFVDDCYFSEYRISEVTLTNPNFWRLTELLRRKKLNLGLIFDFSSNYALKRSAIQIKRKNLTLYFFGVAFFSFIHNIRMIYWILKSFCSIIEVNLLSIIVILKY